ncbi:MAG TPA: hypothetical protein VH817_19365 [Thermoleophilaceae bacterium]
MGDKNEQLYCDGENEYFPKDQFKNGIHTSANPQHYRVGGAAVDPEPIEPAFRLTRLDQPGDAD